MNGEKLRELLGSQSLFSQNITLLSQVDSTNDLLKKLADEGAPEGTVLLAEEQTAGRGTHNRSFYSPAGTGLYLSALLRPKAELADLFTLTGWVAVAVRDAIEQACGAPCGIKWLNDITLNGKKICGVLTELPPVVGETADYAVVGIGINVSQRPEDFAAQGLQEIAASLDMEGYKVSREALAASVLRELERLLEEFPRERAHWLSRYRAHCLTLGKEIETECVRGRAEQINENFGLVVRTKQGEQTVFSGTVRVL